MPRGLVIVLVALGASVNAQSATGSSAALRLPRLFADGMVMQRDARLPVWGWAAPGSNVTVRLANRTAQSTADSAGAWMVTFPPMRPGAPIALAVESREARLAVRDILIGDVWVAAGQSNMELTVSVANNAAQEIAAAHDPQIRHFKVPNSWANAPADDLAGGAWVPADSQHVGNFSAVGYFFARELRRSVGVPIGLINSSWGGSNIETWISRTGQGMTERTWQDIEQRERAWSDAIQDSLRARLGSLPTVDAGMVDGHAVWADPLLDEREWASLPVPGYWENAGYAGMDGIAWYRTSFTLTGDEAKQGARLALGPIDDDDITWVNGIEVGRTSGYLIPRVYALPPTALRAGRNVLVVRVADGGGGGGIAGGSAAVRLDIDGAQRALAGPWKFRIGEVAIKPDGQHINKIPTILYNRMVHPLLRFPIKGVIWYQGESNANNYDQARAYRPLFAQLIESWRHEWRNDGHAFPFLWAQLPNFGAADSVPRARGAWAAHRESMSAALALPHTGQAVTIDVGDATDLHPRNKQDVGLRLALVARKVTYGQSLVFSGPTYRAHVVRGGRVTIEFNHLGAGLVSHTGNANVGGFAIAGADQRFVWAQAAIEGNHVIVWSDHILAPVAVRYAWSDNPSAASLYNRDGLPAAPFRTDAW